MAGSCTNVERRPIRLFAVLLLGLAVLACGARIATEELVEKVETDHGVELRRTVRFYLVTPAPPLEELVKVQRVESDPQVEIVNIEITPGLGPPSRHPDAPPGPPLMSFMVPVTSRNHGPAGTIRTQISIEDPITDETHTTHVDEFVDRGDTTGPYLGFHVEQKPWRVHVEVRVVSRP